MSNSASSEPDCANCGAPRPAAFCAECGQNDDDYRRSLTGLVRSFLSETFDLDGRLTRTIKHLFTQPGFLSEEFSLNRRASYVSPFRLYLFASLIFFFCLSLSTDRSDIRVAEDRPVIVELRDQANANDPSNRKESETADPEILRGILDSPEAQIAERILEQTESPVKRDVLNAYALLLQKNSTASERAEHLWWLQPLTSRVVEAADKPERLVNEFSESIPLAMFILLPAYALFLKILFYSRQKSIFYSEHMVFAIHLHVLAFLIFAVNLLLPDAFLVGEVVFVALFLYLGVYTYRAMRNYYVRGRYATLWRFGLLGILYTSLFLPALGLVMAYAFIAL
ncbi:MAG: DUF3667 domain-containing protein [Pseudomonadales bacterium]